MTYETRLREYASLHSIDLRLQRGSFRGAAAGQGRHLPSYYGESNLGSYWVIVTGWQETLTSYLTGLHEFGHHVHKHTENLRFVWEPPEKILIQEVEAWEWALSQLDVIPQEVPEFIFERGLCLDDYVKVYGSHPCVTTFEMKVRSLVQA